MHCRPVFLLPQPPQLNMRKLLEDSKLPAINIICQKVASEGLTRFEDRHRLPLGISVNLNSFAAKLLAQVQKCDSLHINSILQCCPEHFKTWCTGRLGMEGCVCQQCTPFVCVGDPCRSPPTR